MDHINSYWLIKPQVVPLIAIVKRHDGPLDSDHFQHNILSTHP